MGLSLNWSVISQNIDVFIKGAGLTLQISALALIFSIPIGIILGLLKVSNNKFLYTFATMYIEIMRGIPLLVLLIWIYFALGSLITITAYWSAIAGLALFSGAFVAEIIRAGIEAVSRGQKEAALASGMTYVQTMRFIILPQAMRMILPPLASQFIILIKDSSLVSVISV
ncbi:MAG: amino acid ABC transporter permease, partial [Prolixibacteraceae bacterium]|nr:amino acid ABC transporter permease [Prolixibacteraceae bacterium]